MWYLLRRVSNKGGGGMKRGSVCFFVLLWPAMLCATDTELSLYRPFTETSTHPTMIASAQKIGECHQQSERLKREDAWRCIVEGTVYDPCFVKPYGTHQEAVCPESPWSNAGIQIKVASVLEDSSHDTLDMSRTYPWAIELLGGEKCQAIDAVETYDGLPIRYRCERNSVLIGHVQRCASEWKMLQRGPDGVSTATIGRAWF